MDLRTTLVGVGSGFAASCEPWNSATQSCPALRPAKRRSAMSPACARPLHRVACWLWSGAITLTSPARRRLPATCGLTRAVGARAGSLSRPDNSVGRSAVASSAALWFLTSGAHQCYPNP